MENHTIRLCANNRNRFCLDVHDDVGDCLLQS